VPRPPVLTAARSRGVRRAAFVTSAIERRAILTRIADQTRHKSLEMLGRYARHSGHYKQHAGHDFL
jgi:hypothetical protein